MSNLKEFYMALDKAEAADVGQNAAREALHEACKKEAAAIAERIKQADAGKGDFTVYELTFSAVSRCSCGAGMAYPEGIGMRGSWYCSAVLLGKADPEKEHAALPFAFYEVKSESQPSMRGATTRPDGTHVETEPFYACHACGNTGNAPRFRESEGRQLRNIVCEKCGERYLNEDGSSNSKMHTRYFHVVVADTEPV